MSSGAGAGVTFLGTRAGVKKGDSDHLWFAMRVVVGSTLAFAALVAEVMRRIFDGTGLILLCSCLRFSVWVSFH